MKPPPAMRWRYVDPLAVSPRWRHGQLVEVRVAAYADPFSENYLPEFLGHGSAHDVSNDSDDRGFYLADGTWRPLPRRRMGF